MASKPDPAAVAFTDAFSDSIGLPRMIGRGVVQGESRFRFDAVGDGGRAAGLLQVRTDVHGGTPADWMGEEGARRSIDLMRPRWQRAVELVPLPSIYARLPFTERVATLARFWAASQGASQAAVAGRAEQVLRETEALFGEGEPMVVTQPALTWFPAHKDNYTVGRTEGIDREGIVIHTTDGGNSIEALGAWFANPDAQASTHYGVGPDGRIGQFVSLQNTARAHGIKDHPTAQVVLDNGNLNPNDYLIGIELLDNGTPGNHTPVQIEAAAKLAAWLWQSEIAPFAAQTGATISRERIIGHYEIDSVNRARCPSWPALRWSDFVARVAALVGGDAPPVEDYRARWIAELNGIIVAATDDATRAAVRIEDARRKLTALGA